MKVICRTRRKGKTSELLILAVLNRYAFVCHSQMEYRRLLDICKREGMEPPLFVTYDQFLDGRLKTHREITGIVVDNVDMLLQRLAGNIEVIAVAINQSGEEPLND